MLFRSPRMSLNGQVPNGSAQDPIEIPSLQTVIGINFGNSFASIAVLTKVCSPFLKIFFTRRQLGTMIDWGNCMNRRA